MKGFARLQSSGQEVLLVLFPCLERKAYQDWNFGLFHERYATEAAHLDLPFFDLYPAFDRAGLIVDRFNLHPTSEGHRVAGGAIVPELTRRRELENFKISAAGKSCRIFPAPEK